MSFNLSSESQYRAVFKTGEKSKFNMPENIEGYWNQCLPSLITKLSIDIVIPFLDYQIKDNPYEKVIFSILNTLLHDSKLPPPRTKLIEPWIEIKTKLSKINRRKIHEFFTEPHFTNDFKFHYHCSLINSFVNKRSIQEGLVFLNYGKELLEQQFELYNIARNPSSSDKTSTSYEDLIDQIKNTIGRKNQVLKSKKTEEKKTKNSIPDFTISRQVLALYYLLDYYNFPLEAVDKTALASFSQLLSGGHSETDIIHTNFYKRWKKNFPQKIKKSK